MGKIGRGFVFIRNKLDYILSVILLFILLSPTAVWDMEYGGLSFYFVVFPVLVVLLAVVCAADYIEKRPGFCAWIRENPWLVAFAAALLVAVVASVNRLLSLSYLLYYLCGVVMASILYMGGLTYEKIRRMFGIVAFGLFLTAVFAVAQRIHGVAVNASFTNLTVNQNMPGRVDSVFGNPNIYGFALASLLPVVAAYTFLCRSRLRMAAGAAAFLLGTAALLMTYSRGAWFGFAVGIVILVALYKPKLIPVILVLGVVALLILPNSIMNRVFTIFNPNDTSISYRGLLMNSGLQVILDRPVFGAGLGLETVRALVDQFYWPADIDPKYYFYHTHNLLLQMWCEMGVAGCVTFFGAVIHNIVRAVRGFRQKSWQIRMLIASLIAGMAAMICCGIADCPLNTLRTMLIFWILFGLLAAAGKVREPAPPCEGEGASAAAAE